MARRRGNGAKHAVQQWRGAEEARRAGVVRALVVEAGDGAANGAEGEVGAGGGHGLVGLAVVVRTGTERHGRGRMLVADVDNG